MTKSKKQLTPWFDGRVKPVHKGVYQQMNGINELGYQRWDGVRWYSWSSTPDGAAKSNFAASAVFQDERWRGLVCPSS